MARNYLYSVFFILLSTAVFEYRVVISTFLGALANYLMLLVLVVPLMVLLLTIYKARIQRFWVLPFVYVLYLLVCFVVFPLKENSYCSSSLVAFFGFFNLGVPFLLWLSVFSISNDHERVWQFALKVILFVCFTNAVGAIIQYYFSPTMYGLIDHAVYSREFLSENISKRAVSFITAPQSLSLVLAIGFVTALNIAFLSQIIKACVCVIIFLGGILTLSKAFFLFVFVYFMLSSTKSLKGLIRAIVFLIGLLSLLIINQSIFERVADIQHYASNLSTYSAYPIWRDFIFLPETVLEVFTGVGLGLASRGAQETFSYVLLNGSAESFFIQMYVEIGLVGLFLFLLVFMVSVTKLRARSSHRWASDCLLSAAVVGLFAPSLYGLASGFIFYAFLSFGLAIGVKGPSPVRCWKRQRIFTPLTVLKYTDERRS